VAVWNVRVEARWGVSGVAVMVFVLCLCLCFVYVVLSCSVARLGVP
jgi:hypothetical protein